MVSVINKTAPKLLSLTPNTGSSAMPLSQDLTLTFNEAIQLGTGKISLNKGSSSVVLQSNEIEVNGKTVIINPAADLLSNSHYTLKLANGAINNSAGNNYAGKSFSFDTIDTLAPTLKVTSPGNGHKLVSLNRNIDFIFNEKIQAGTGNIILSNGSDIRTISVTDKQVSINGKKLTLNPSEDFGFNSTYSVHIESNTIQDLSGNLFAGNNFKFSTAFVLSDTTAPLLTQTLPKNNAKNVATDSDVKLIFNEILQLGSGEIEINNGAVSTKIPVSDSTQVTLNKNVLLINPAADFELGNHYVVTLPKGVVLDKAGNELAVTAFNFNTPDFISTGTAIDGYLKGATIFADRNENGIWDKGEAKTISDDNGDFKLTNAKGTIIASGGTDLTSGQAFTGTLKAPAGSSVITPLTTVQQGFVESGQTAAEAQKSVAKAFGFSETINLKTYDPIKVLENAKTVADKQAATELMASTAKLANFLVMAGQVLQGAADKDTSTGKENLSMQNANNALLDALVTAIKNDVKTGDGKIDLADSTLLKTILIGSSKLSEGDKTNFTATESNAYEAKVSKMADSVTEILKNSANSITDAVSKGGDATTLLSNMGKVSSFTQNDAGSILKETARTLDMTSSTVETNLKNLATTLNTLQNSTDNFESKSAAMSDALQNWITTDNSAAEQAAADQKIIDDAAAAKKITNAAAAQKVIDDAAATATLVANTPEVKILDTLSGTISSPATFDASTGHRLFTLTDSVATASFSHITNFGADDSLKITGIGSNHVSIANHGADVVFTVNDNGTASQITLVGVTSVSAIIGSIDAFNALPVGNVTYA